MALPDNRWASNSSLVQIFTLTAPGKDFPVTKAPPLDALRGATREALRNLVSLAIGEKVAFILLAGDLYDGDWRGYPTGLFLGQQLGRLREAD
jgi:exonuclease SbcD